MFSRNDDIKTNFNLKYYTNITSGQSFKKVYLLLHGYGQNGMKLLENVSPFLPNDSLIISVNGPFPIPQKIKATSNSKADYKLGFAWYFFNPNDSSYYLDYEFSANLLSKLIDRLSKEFNFSQISLIGYSQGGYLAPFVAQKNKIIQEIICIACVLKHELLSKEFPFSIHQIQSPSDTVIDFTKAKSAFHKISHKCDDAHFYEIEDEGHFLWNKNKITNYLKTIKTITQ